MLELGSCSVSSQSLTDDHNALGLPPASGGPESPAAGFGQLCGGSSPRLHVLYPSPTDCESWQKHRGGLAGDSSPYSEPNALLEPQSLSASYDTLYLPQMSGQAQTLHPNRLGLSLDVASTFDAGVGMLGADGDLAVSPNVIKRRRGGLIEQRDIVKAHQAHKIHSTPQARRKEWEYPMPARSELFEGTNQGNPGRQERKLSGFPYLEIYHSDVINYMVPLSHQTDFFVPEMTEEPKAEVKDEDSDEDRGTDITGADSHSDVSSVSGGVPWDSRETSLAASTAASLASSLPLRDIMDSNEDSKHMEHSDRGSNDSVGSGSSFEELDMDQEELEGGQETEDGKEKETPEEEEGAGEDVGLVAKQRLLGDGEE